MAEENIDEIGFDDETITGDRAPKFSGKKGVTDRIGFIFPKGNKVAKTHFHTKHVICKGGLCCEKMKPAEKRIGNIIIKYGTDKTGKVKSPFSYELMTWVFSEKKYAQLRTVNQEQSLEDHDLLITCVEEKYQNLQITACKEALWKKNEKLKEHVLAEATKLREKIYLGADLTTDQIKEFLGQETETAAGADAGSADYSDVLNEMDI